MGIPTCHTEEMDVPTAENVVFQKNMTNPRLQDGPLSTGVVSKGVADLVDDEFIIQRVEATNQGVQECVYGHGTGINDIVKSPRLVDVPDRCPSGLTHALNVEIETQPLGVPGDHLPKSGVEDHLPTSGVAEDPAPTTTLPEDPAPAAGVSEVPASTSAVPEAPGQQSDVSSWLISRRTRNAVQGSGISKGIVTVPESQTPPLAQGSSLAPQSLPPRTVHVSRASQEDPSRPIETPCTP